MKQAFTNAHQDLRGIDATVDELGFHSTNAINQIIHHIRDEIPNDGSSTPTTANPQCFPSGLQIETPPTPCH